MAKLKLIPGGKDHARRFEALLRAHYDALYRSAYRWTRSVHDAEDLVQELCVRAYPRLAEIEALDRPRAWLIRVMYRLFVDQSRRYERNHVGSLESCEAVLASEDAGPDEDAERALSRERLERAWQRMPADQRALLALHDLEGYSLAELQTMTELKEGTLKSRLHRARVRLGRLLRQQGGVGLLQAEAGGSR